MPQSVLNEGLLSGLVLGGLVKIRGWAEGLPKDVKNSPEVAELIKLAAGIDDQNLPESWWQQFNEAFKLSPDELTRVRTQAGRIGSDWMKYTNNLYGKEPLADRKSRSGTTERDAAAAAAGVPGSDSSHANVAGQLNQAMQNMYEILKQFDDLAKRSGVHESVWSSRIIADGLAGRAARTLGNVAGATGGGLKKLAKMALDMTNPVTDYRKGRAILIANNNRLTAICAIKMASQINATKRTTP